MLFSFLIKTTWCYRASLISVLCFQMCWCGVMSVSSVGFRPLVSKSTAATFVRVASMVHCSPWMIPLITTPWLCCCRSPLRTHRCTKPNVYDVSPSSCCFSYLKAQTWSLFSHENQLVPTLSKKSFVRTASAFSLLFIRLPVWSIFTAGMLKTSVIRLHHTCLFLSKCFQMCNCTDQFK